MKIKKDETLVMMIRGLAGYYQRILDQADEIEDDDPWLVNANIANKALEILNKDYFDMQAVDELYQHLQDVDDDLIGSASFDLRSVVRQLKAYADAERKQT